MSSLSQRLKLPYSIFLHYLLQSCWTSRWYWAHELRDSENPGCSSPVHPETLLLPSLSLFLPFPYSHLLWTSYSNLSELPEQPENCSHSVIKQAPLRKKLMWMVIKVSIQLKVGQMFNPASLQDIQGHHVDSQIDFRKRDQLLSPTGLGSKDSAMLSSPGITFIENPSFIKHGFVVYISLICFAKLRSQSFAYNPRGSSSHCCSTPLVTAVTRVTSPAFMAAKLCLLLKTSWFNGLNSDTPHRSGTQHCFMGAGGEMHSLPSSWKCCCHWEQDWLIHKSRLFVHKLQRQTWHRAVLSFLYL